MARAYRGTLRALNVNKKGPYKNCSFFPRHCWCKIPLVATTEPSRQTGQEHGSLQALQGRGIEERHHHFQHCTPSTLDHAEPIFLQRAPSELTSRHVPKTCAPCPARPSSL